jgi:hypothetical protein
VYTSPCAEFELTTLVVIVGLTSPQAGIMGIDCISCNHDNLCCSPDEKKNTGKDQMKMSIKRNKFKKIMVSDSSSFSSDDSEDDKFDERRQNR